jgi:hypothetical protein
MQKIETPNGNEQYLRIRGSIEKIVLRKKLSKGEFTSFSDRILSPRRRIRRLAVRIGKKRKKLK